MRGPFPWDWCSSEISGKRLLRSSRCARKKPPILGRRECSRLATPNARVSPVPPLGLGKGRARLWVQDRYARELETLKTEYGKLKRAVETAQSALAGAQILSLVQVMWESSGVHGGEGHGEVQPVLEKSTCIVEVQNLGSARCTLAAGRIESGTDRMCPCDTRSWGRHTYSASDGSARFTSAKAS